MLTVITNARVFAPEPLGIVHLLVGGGQILAIDAEPIEIAGATRFDCEGRTLVPGFIDGHAHITGGGGEAGFSTRVPAPHLSEFTAAGVTSVVGVLGTDDTARDTRSLLAQVYALREEGLGAFCHTGGYHVPPTTLTGNVRDDIVFLEPVIGVGELAISDHRSSQPTSAEILRVASDAHVAGLIAGKAGILHLHLGDGPRGLELVRKGLRETELPARVFNPTHVNRNKSLFIEAVELTRLGSYVDITAFPVDEEDDAWPADVALQRYFDSGAPASCVTISSDGGGCLPVFDEQGQMVRMDVGSSHELSKTLQSLLWSGMSLEAALPPFTANAADLLRLPDRGRIRAGNRADLVILDEDYLPDSVMAGGRWHRYKGQQMIQGRFEPERGHHQQSTITRSRA